MEVQRFNRGRSHTCGALSEKNIGQTVTLCGWVARRRDHGGLIFVDLRDRYGLTQIVFDPNAGEVAGKAHDLGGTLRSEFVISCSGKVRSRPQGMINAKLETGGIEVLVDDLQILSEAKTPPFPIEDESEVSEQVRLKYRYLDLRRAYLQRNLIERHRILSIARQYLNDNGFIEVETPILYKSTPEGARDFVVPSRLNLGEFYALPQSPQTLKQLLMISGMDRYYQVARCFRDEDLRADRQPEFSQIDIEASFINEEIFFPIMENLMAKLWREILGVELKTPFPRMAYSEAMDRFGSDKPDVRFGLELQDLSGVFKNSDFQVFANALKAKKGAVRAICIEGQSDRFSRKDLDDLQKVTASFGAKGLLWIKVNAATNGIELQSPAAKFFSENEKRELECSLQLKAGDLVLIVADSQSKVVFDSLGALRLEIGQRLGLVPADGDKNPAFLWVTGFPLLVYDEKEKRYFAAHHPFTSPRPDHLEKFVSGSDLEDVEASAYDLVLNGVEVAGGSLRIFQTTVQAAMFRALGMSEDEAQKQFGFFLEALKYGTPPHGGIAIGVERLVGILCGVGPIRDVMAFPKTQSGSCLMSGSPSILAPAQLKELGIRVNV